MTFTEIFKGNSFDQLLKQAEIDVLGFNAVEYEIYAVDIAFHEAGLNYKGREETIKNVFKKIFRAIYVTQVYFGEINKVHSIFVSPKVHNKVQSYLDEALEIGRTLIDDENISIDIISNEGFYDTIVDNTLRQAIEESDTSELFMRAVKLLKGDKRADSKDVAQSVTKVKKPKRSQTDSHQEEGMKIGQYVQHIFRTLYAQSKISSEEISQLQDLDYCKEQFKANVPVLLKQGKDIRDHLGRARYYAKEGFCGDYYLSSQWVERNWDGLLSWVQRMTS